MQSGGVFFVPLRRDLGIWARQSQSQDSNEIMPSLRAWLEHLQLGHHLEKVGAGSVGWVLGPLRPSRQSGSLGRLGFGRFWARGAMIERTGMWRFAEVFRLGAGSLLPQPTPGKASLGLLRAFKSRQFWRPSDGFCFVDPDGFTGLLKIILSPFCNHPFEDVAFSFHPNKEMEASNYELQALFRCMHAERIPVMCCFYKSGL